MSQTYPDLGLPRCGRIAAVVAAGEAAAAVAMLRVSLAATGATVLETEDAPTVLATLKRRLAEGLGVASRFRLKLLRDEAPLELPEEELLTPPMDLQLVVLNLWPPDPAMDERFLLACKTNRCEEVEAMLQRPQDPETRDHEGKSGLHWAAQKGHLRCVKLLLEAGAEVLSFDGIAGTSAVHRAAEHGHLAVLQALLLVEPGAKDAISEHGLTPLRLAALNGHRELVEFLLEVGADKDKSSAVGATALHLAALNGHVEVVRLLLAASMEIDKASTAGATPLHLAAVNGHPDVVRVLLEAGAEVDRLTGGGKTPLHGAALYGHVTVVRILLDFGADREVATEAGLVAGQLAAKNGHVKLQEMLSAATSS